MTNYLTHVSQVLVQSLYTVIEVTDRVTVFFTVFNLFVHLKLNVTINVQVISLSHFNCKENWEYLVMETSADLIVTNPWIRFFLMIAIVWKTSFEATTMTSVRVDIYTIFRLIWKELENTDCSAERHSPDNRERNLPYLQHKLMHVYTCTIHGTELINEFENSETNS